MNQHPYPVPDPRNPGAPPSLVFFEEDAIPNPKASQDAGVPIFDNVVYARVLVPGQSKSDVKYEVYRKRPDGSEKLSEQYRFGSAFNQWREKQQPPDSGTPLDRVPYLNKAQIETLRHVNIFTEQQLAQVSDTALQHIGMGARELRAQAQARLAEGGKDAVLTKQASEIEELKARCDSLERLLREATAQTQGFTKPRRRRKISDEPDMPDMEETA